MSTDYGMKSSREGVDVFDFVLEQGSVTSQYSNHKIQLNQSPAHISLLEYTHGSEPGNGTTTLLTVAHGYSYAPAFWVMMDRGSAYGSATGQYQFTPYYVSGFAGLPPVLVEDLWYAYTDDTNLYIKLWRSNQGSNPNAMNGDTNTFKYMIFAEDGAS